MFYKSEPVFFCSHFGQIAFATIRLHPIPELALPLKIARIGSNAAWPQACFVSPAKDPIRPRYRKTEYRLSFLKVDLKNATWCQTGETELRPAFPGLLRNRFLPHAFFELPAEHLHFFLFPVSGKNSFRCRKVFVEVFYCFLLFSRCQRIDNLLVQQYNPH